MSSSDPGDLDDLAHGNLTLLRDGAMQLHRVENTHPPVLAATPASSDPHGAIAQLRYEFGIRSALDHGFALRPIRLLTHCGNPAMLLPDPGGQMLSDLCGAALELDEFLLHAVQITLAVAAAHACNVVHGALSPGNIMVHRARRRAWLTGFRCAPDVQRAPIMPDGVVSQIEFDVLHYMAPEATGRLNRPIDARSDLYSLGCILYQMLTGSVPFPDLTPHEVVHAHIARKPTDSLASRALLGKLTSVLMRMMAKEPGERYQSAAHVVTELLACQANKAVDSPLTQIARTKLALTAPSALVHRKHEIECLRKAAFDASEGKATRLLLLEGPAGIGKTALVHHLRKKLDDLPHEFAMGKCEQAEGATPYASLARALQYLLGEIVRYPQDEYERIRTRIKDALADDAPIVTAILPALAQVLGTVEPRRDVSDHAHGPRLLNAMSKLLGAFAVRGRPLILFLDDLQWVDEGTVEVLAHTIRNPSTQSVLCIGAVRSNEIRAEHSPAVSLSRTARVERLPLGPLSQNDIAQLLRTSLSGEVGRIEAVSGLIHLHTGGNPLFAIQFLRSLVDENELDYDDAAREWRINLRPFGANRAASGFVELLAGKIDTLAVETKAVLRCLALLGQPASAATLAAAMHSSAPEIEGRLGGAIALQFVHWDGERYTFSHDRVRDAVCHGLSESERLKGHLHIGRNLMASEPNPAAPICTLAVANQLTMAMPAIDSADERRSCALLIIEAAKLAKEDTAYALAMSYLSSARRFIGECTGSEYVNALIELRLGECELLRMEVGRAERRLRQVRSDLLTDRHRAELVRLRVAIHTTRDQPMIALDLGLRYLAEETGIELTSTPGDEDVDTEYAAFGALYAGQSIENLLNLPSMRDEKLEYAMDVLADLVPAALFTNRNLDDIVILRMASLSLQYGHCDASCFSYVCLSQVLSKRYGDHRAASLFGRLAMRLGQERGVSRFEGRVRMCYGALNLPWTESAALARQHIYASIDLTTRQGDITFVVYSRRALVTNLIFSGHPLVDTQASVEEGIKFARRAGFAVVIDALVAQASLIRSLRGLPVDIGVPDPEPDYKALLADCLSAQVSRGIAAFSFWTHQLQVAYLFRDFSTALQAEENASRFAWTSRSFLETADFTFFSALLRIALSQHSSGRDRNLHMDLARERLLLLTQWAEACPSNFLARLKLVLAQLEDAREDALRAYDLYEQAIQLSTDAGMPHVLALSCELAARSCATRHWHASEQAYLKEAWNAYARWGAEAKLRHLEQEFAHLKPQPGARAPGIAPTSDAQFDAQAVLRAAQALSSELSPARLIHVLVCNALQYAGAERAVLCLLTEGTLNVVAQTRFLHGTVEVSMKEGPASQDVLPTSIAYATLMTRESIVLHDGGADRHYGKDAYVVAHRAKSIMCVPLAKQCALLGVLYMENNLISGAFTSARRQTLEVLASQAAISLENARLYETLQAAHRERAATESHLRETRAKLDKVAKLTAMGELAASIIHEVSQPLSAIGTSSQAAMRWLDRDTPELEEGLAMLRQISAASDRAGSIVESIRAMSKKAPPRFGRMDIHDAIREVLRLLREQLSSNGVEIRGNFDSGERHVIADRTLLQQVILNLVVNAHEAMSDGVDRKKVIEIETRIAQDDVLWVSVTDTGPGVSGKAAAGVFDSFFTTKDTGMGMGLSICKSIVEAHGGEIEAVSGLRTGACFRFSVPQAIASADTEGRRFIGEFV